VRPFGGEDTGGDVADVTKEELKQLKKDYLELDRLHHEEKEVLIRVVRALGSAVPEGPELDGAVEALEDALAHEEPLDQDRVQEALDRFKRGLRSMPQDPREAAGASATPDGLAERWLEACRALQRVMVLLLEDFYPLSSELSERAREIHLECVDAGGETDIEGTAGMFLAYLEGLKEGIAEDFREISRTLFTLLDQVKELEASFVGEYGTQGVRVKEIEYFEMKVNTEMGSIVESFDIHTTVSEIKKAVTRKIENLKTLVTQRKQEELSRSASFQESIQTLKQRIDEVERDALEMSRRAEQFQVAAMKDELTDLYNRKAFDERMRQALEAFNRGGTPFALILFDVDRFKEINDTFGHVAGDKVLQKVSDCLRDTFRRDDFIARYGGDEFVVLIEELSRDLARDKILAFMKNLQRLRFTSHARGDISVGVSPGIAMAKKGDTPETLLERADQAMYEVKKRRR
jgi:diguanylate cyclase